MTPLPSAITHPAAGVGLHAWRLDRAVHKSTWDSGEGAFRAGGRWNDKGVRAVYCAIDPAAAILEVAVHVGFHTLDTVPHVLTSFVIHDPATVHVVSEDDVPNPNWLAPGLPTGGQKTFGSSLLKAHLFVLIPSVVSRQSWNLIFDANSVPRGSYSLVSQERFGLDPRLTRSR